MKQLLFMLLLLASTSVAAQVRLDCPPCRPFLGCNQCWATQQEANACNQRVKSNLNNEKLEVVSEHALRVYPNPSTTGNFFLESDQKIHGKLTLMSHDKVVYQGRLDGKKRYEITKLSKYPTGLYYVILMRDDGKIERFKLVVH